MSLLSSRRRFQFSLRTLLVAVSFVGVFLGLFFGTRSLNKAIDEHTRVLRLDQADMLFNAQLDMAEERLQTHDFPAPRQRNCRSILKTSAAGNELNRVIAWDFSYHTKDDVATIRGEIRCCLEASHTMVGESQRTLVLELGR